MNAVVLTTLNKKKTCPLLSLSPDQQCHTSTSTPCTNAAVSHSRIQKTNQQRGKSNTAQIDLRLSRCWLPALTKRTQQVPSAAPPFLFPCHFFAHNCSAWLSGNSKNRKKPQLKQQQKLIFSREEGIEEESYRRLCLSVCCSTQDQYIYFLCIYSERSNTVICGCFLVCTFLGRFVVPESVFLNIFFFSDPLITDFSPRCRFQSSRYPPAH